MLQTLFWIVSLVVLVLTLVGRHHNQLDIRSDATRLACARPSVPARAIGNEFYIESSLYLLYLRPHRHRNRLRTRQ